MDFTFRETKFYLWLAGKLPSKVVYFCAIHVVAHATTGKYSTTNTPKITAMEALKRYEDDKVKYHASN